MTTPELNTKFENTQKGLKFETFSDLIAKLKHCWKQREFQIDDVTFKLGTVTHVERKLIASGCADLMGGDIGAVFQSPKNPDIVAAVQEVNKHISVNEKFISDDSEFFEKEEYIGTYLLYTPISILVYTAPFLPKNFID